MCVYSIESRQIMRAVIYESKVIYESQDSLIRIAGAAGLSRERMHKWQSTGGQYHSWRIVALDRGKRLDAHPCSLVAARLVKAA